jgi:hypothetical protein
MGAEITCHNTLACVDAPERTIAAGSGCTSTQANGDFEAVRAEAGTWQTMGCPAMEAHTGAVMFSGQVELCCE